LLASIVISVFGIVILGTLALLFNAKHEELVGSGKNPPASQGPAIAQTIGIAVMIYTVRRNLLPKEVGCTLVGHLGEGGYHDRLQAMRNPVYCWSLNF